MICERSTGSPRSGGPAAYSGVARREVVGAELRPKLNVVEQVVAFRRSVAVPLSAVTAVEIRRTWESRIKVRQGATTWRVVELLLRQPVVNAALLSTELGIAQPNVYRTLEPLEAAGILVPTGGSRGRIWRSPEVLDALDAFAERARGWRQPTG